MDLKAVNVSAWFFFNYPHFLQKEKLLIIKKISYLLHRWVCSYRRGNRSSGFRGGCFPPQGFDPLPTQRVPLCTILRYPYLVTDPKKFLKAPLAQIHTIFWGGARAKKTRFLCQSFPKSAQKLLFLPVFSKTCLRRRKGGQVRAFIVVWENSENQFGLVDLKKSRQNFWNFLKLLFGTCLFFLEFQAFRSYDPGF